MFAALYSRSLSPAPLIAVAQDFTPRYEVLGPVVLLDTSGLSRLFGRANDLGDHLHCAASGCDREISVALAPTAIAAILLALGRPGLSVTTPDHQLRALATLPIDLLHDAECVRAHVGAADAAQAIANPQHPQSVLTAGWAHPRDAHQGSRTRAGRAEALRTGRAEPNTSAAARKARQIDGHARDTLAVLRRWGISTLGELAALPRPDVFARLGERGTRWQRMACGEDERPLVPWVEEDRYEAMLDLEWPIEGLEPLSFVLARLFEPLIERLARAHCGAAIIHTELRLVTRDVHARTLQLPAPMHDPKTLRTLVLLDLESTPPPAAIDRVRLAIEPTPARVCQWMLFERAQPSPEHVTTLLARLTALMGAGHVGTPAVVSSWRPGAFELREFTVQDGPCAVRRKQERGTLTCAVRRFRLPIPARVTLHEGRPVRVHVDRRGLSSGSVVCAAGPWRTSGEWWNTGRHPAPDTRQPMRDPLPAASCSLPTSSAWNRDEWDAALSDGTIYRLFVERDVGQWFIEGVVD